MSIHDLSQIEQIGEIQNLKYFFYYHFQPILILVMIEDLIHHRLRESHQKKAIIMNFIKKFVEINVICIIMIYSKVLNF